MKRLLALSVIALSLLTSGCDDTYEDPHEDAYPPDYTPDIRSFNLIPAPGARAWEYGATPITPHVDGGSFTMQWEIQSYGPYSVDLYVSNDPWLGPQDPWEREDLLFKHFGGIGYGSDAYRIDTLFMNCRFSIDNVLSCGGLNYANPGRDITPFLNVLPKTGYLILRACDDYSQDCAISARYVEFQ